MWSFKWERESFEFGDKWINISLEVQEKYEENITFFSTTQSFVGLLIKTMGVDYVSCQKPPCVKRVTARPLKRATIVPHLQRVTSYSVQNYCKTRTMHHIYIRDYQFMSPAPYPMLDMSSSWYKWLQTQFGFATILHHFVCFLYPTRSGSIANKIVSIEDPLPLVVHSGDGLVSCVISGTKVSIKTTHTLN